MTDSLSPQEFSEADGTGDWSVDGDVARASFKTRSFNTGVSFITEIGRLADAANHHPDVDLRYATVTVALTSHDIGGLSRRDAALAREISGVARELGISVAPPASA